MCSLALSSHTNHNQSKKAHKNGIKKPKGHRTRSLKGVCTFLVSYAYRTDGVSSHRSMLRFVGETDTGGQSLHFITVPQKRTRCSCWIGAFLLRCLKSSRFPNFIHRSKHAWSREQRKQHHDMLYRDRCMTTRKYALDPVMLCTCYAPSFVTEKHFQKHNSLVQSIVRRSSWNDECIVQSQWSGASTSTCIDTNIKMKRDMQSIAPFRLSEHLMAVDCGSSSHSGPTSPAA